MTYPIPQVLNLREISLDDLIFGATTVAHRYGKHVKGICFAETHPSDPNPLHPSPTVAQAEAYLAMVESQLPKGGHELLLSVRSMGLFNGFLETFLHVVIIRRLPIVRSITVDYTFARDDEPYEELLRAIHSIAPRVRELALVCEETVETSLRHRIAQTWLAPFTGVGFLDLYFEEHEEENQVSTWPAPPLAPLPLIQAFTGMTKLESLELDNEALLSPELARADWSRVPLKSLNVSLGRPNSDGIMSLASLLPLIAQLGNTLNYLDITSVYMDLPSPARRLHGPPPPPLQKLSLPHLTYLHLDILDPTGAFISSFSHCPIVRLALSGCAIGTPIIAFTRLINGSWKPTLRHLELPYDDQNHFQPLKTIATFNGVTVELEEKLPEDVFELELDDEREDEDAEDDDFGYWSGQERYNDLLGIGNAFIMDDLEDL